MTKILIAENEPPQLELLCLLLNEASFEVIPAQDGDLALALAAEHQPDIALLDVVMPGKNGFHVCMQLKRRKQTRHTKVVLYTARTSFADWLKAVEAGAHAFWPKPLPPKLLIQKLKQLSQ